MRESSPDELRARLLSMAEPDYRDFSVGLIPGEKELLGIRLPVLRRLAGEIAQGDWEAFLSEGYTHYFEEVMLRGMVVGAAPMILSERLRAVRDFVPYIQNWSVCDSFCAGLKDAAWEQEAFYDLLCPYLRSESCYEVRFGLVMLLTWYLNDRYIDRVLAHFSQFSHPGYYARMAAAWGISAAFVRYPQKTLPLLRENTLDNFTHNKAIQKIRESLRPTPEDKALVLSLKRKKVLP